MASRPAICLASEGRTPGAREPGGSGRVTKSPRVADVAPCRVQERAALPPVAEIHREKPLQSKMVRVTSRLGNCSHGPRVPGMPTPFALAKVAITFMQRRSGEDVTRAAQSPDNWATRTFYTTGTGRGPGRDEPPCHVH